MEYRFSVEDIEKTQPEFMALYARHYSEMKTRLEGQGLDVSPFKPNLQMYYDANHDGRMIHYCIRECDGNPVGYSNIYVFNDMHNGDFCAQEDTIYVLPEHRNGVGRAFSKFILADLGARGCIRLHVTAMTDLRVEKLWKRMGFRPVATSMIYEFKR
jgi:GNAT superfamily N-acetyltransferase